MINQLDFFQTPEPPRRMPKRVADLFPPTARRLDPETSKAAAASAKELASKHHGVILETLRQHGPLGKDGIASRSRLEANAVARRMKELETAGEVELTGNTVLSTSGRQEREWKLARYVIGLDGQKFPLKAGHLANPRLPSS